MAKSRGRKFAELVAPTNGVFAAASIPTIALSKLASSAVTINSESLSLGGSLTLDTSDIGEHTSNKYFTNARAQATLSVASNSGHGALSYDNSNGQFTFAGITTETIQDLVGAMFSSNTETAVTVTYQDSDGTIDLVVDDTTKLPLAGGTMTGNLTLGDNVNAYFGASTDLRIYHDGTNSHIINSTGELRFTGSNFAIKSDSAKLHFGASDDLQIYHNGNDSIIRDVGTGRLLIGASELLVTNSGLSEAQLQSLEDGAITLYYDGSAKLATTSTGIDITGSISTDGLVSTVGITVDHTDGTDNISLTPTSTGGVVNVRNSSGTSVIALDGRNSQVTIAGFASMATGAATSKFAVGTATVSGSYDFYNNGTGYNNGAFTVDDTLFANNISILGTGILRVGTNQTWSVGVNPSSSIRLAYDGVERSITGHYTDGMSIRTNAHILRLATDGKVHFPAFTFPASDGTNGQVLQTNGSGVLSWSTASGGGSSVFSTSGSDAYYTSGNVGIGTSSPASVLHIEGSTNSYNTSPLLYFGSTSTANAGVRDWAIGPADSAYGNFHIFRGASTGASPIGSAGTVFTIDNAGQVGLGKVGYFAPQAALHVTSSNNQKILLSGSASPYIRWQEGSTNKAYIQWNAGGWLDLANEEDSSTLRLNDKLILYPTTDEAFLIESSGNALRQHIKNTSTTGTYSYLQLSTVNSSSSTSSSYLIKNAPQNTGNSLANASLYLWNSDERIEFIPSGTVANRFTVETSGNITVRGGGTLTGQVTINKEATINTTTPGKAITYGLHFGGQSTADSATGITFSAGSATATDANAGIYVQGSGSYGTKMYIATTDSYATGAKTALQIDHTGLATFIRQTPKVNASVIWHASNDGSGSGLDADLLDGSHASAFATLSGSNSFSNSYNEFGNGTGSVSNDGSWNARVNVAGTAHARSDVKSVSDGIIGTMYAHTGHSGPRFGSMSNHQVDFMINGAVKSTLSTAGSLSTTQQGTLWGNGNDGSGSGLDADLLDGIQSSNFARTDIHETFTSNITVNGNIYTGDGNDGYFYNDTGGRTAFAGGDFYIQNSVTNYYNYATNQYIGDSSGDNIYFRANVLSGTGWSINGAGMLTTRDHLLSAGYHLQRADHHSGHLEGSYNNIGGNGAKSNPIYTIGSNYNPTDAALSNMYGIGFTSTSSSFANPAGGTYNWGMYVAADGDARVWLDGSTGGIWSTGQHYVGSNLVWNAGNDGTGSGLDADLLDGIQGNKIQQGLARIAGWEPGYSNNTEASVYYDYTERAIVIDGANDSNNGAVFKAVRVEAGDKLQFTVQIKGSGASSSGMYIRLYVYNGELPNGKTHVSNDASGSTFVQEDSTGDTSWYENGAVSTSYVSFTRSYTATQTSWVSLVVLNWGGHGTKKLYVRNPDLVHGKGRSDRFITGGLYGTGHGSSLLPVWQYNAANTGYGFGYTEGSPDHWDFDVSGQLLSGTPDFSIYPNETRVNGYTVWHTGNDGSGSGLDADTVDGLNPKSQTGNTSGEQILRSHTNSYFYHGSWIQVGGGGLFSTTTNGAHFMPNNNTTYATWKSSGAKNGYDGILFDSGGDVAVMFDSAGNGGFYRQSSSRWYMYHHVNNNCTGINTSGTSSSYGLQVVGGIYSDGNIVAYSDRRIKENIVPIDNALEKVNKLAGVYYNKIDDEKKTREIGFIAQEVNEVAPELVTYAEDIDQYGVKYGNTTALLVEAVKELTQQVKDLKQELEELKNG